MNLHSDRDEIKKRELETMKNIYDTRLQIALDIPDISLRKLIKLILVQLHCNTNLIGYKYIIRAIELLIEEPDYALAFVECYKRIASEYKNKNSSEFIINKKAKLKSPTVSSVEKSMRMVIGKIWLAHCKKQNFILYVLFGEYGDAHPTNSEFVAMIAEYIRILYLEDE